MKGKKLLAALLGAALAISAAVGNYSNSYAAEPEGFPAGDADKSGSVTAKDALTVLKHVVGITALDEEAQLLADADMSGSISAEDALSILKYVVGILEIVPAGCTEHVYGEGRVVQAATLEEEGIMAYTCTKCGYVKEEPIPVLEPCAEHTWDEGIFIEHYLTSTDGRYSGGWELFPISFKLDTFEDTRLDFRIFSRQGFDYRLDLVWNEDIQMYVTDSVLLRTGEEGLKEYTCRVCGEKKVDFCVKQLPVPVEENSVAWDWDDNLMLYLPLETGWTGKNHWLYSDMYYDDYVALTEEIFNKEQELALDELSARFVSGNCGLWEYEASIRAYLSGLGMFDTSETKGELMLGFQIFHKDNLSSSNYAQPGVHYGTWLSTPEGSNQHVSLSTLPSQYVYVNSYWEKENRHSVNYAIKFYVMNPLLEK